MQYVFLSDFLNDKLLSRPLFATLVLQLFLQDRSGKLIKICLCSAIKRHVREV